MYLLIQSKCRSSALLCVLVVLASVGQFAPELSAIRVPGIWFPFDTGVSRAQFAYALFFICAAVALWGEFLHIAERKATRIEGLDGGDAVAIPDRSEPGVAGLMPLSLFRTVYVCNSERYIVFE